MSKKLGEKSLLFFILTLSFLIFKWLLKSPDLQGNELIKDKPQQNTYLKWIVLAVAVLGLFIQLSSFFIDKSDKNPTLQRWVFSDYFNAKQGIETILSRVAAITRSKEKKVARISVEEIGYSELSVIGSELMLKELIRQNPPGTHIPSIKITSISYGGGMLMGEDNIGANIAFHASGITEPSQPFTVTVTELNKTLESEKDRNLFTYSLVLFAVGFFFQVISLIISNLNIARS